MNTKAVVLIVSLGSGAMDATTGALLAGAPAATLSLFGATLPGGEAAAILMRFVGVFVAGVGLSYLWALAATSPAVRARRLPGVWGGTAIVRAGVAVFCFAAVASHRLEPAWLAVGATDAMLAAIQILGLRAGWLRDTT
jgi:hypothetical protein